jgi:hypothetical protein
MNGTPWGAGMRRLFSHTDERTACAHGFSASGQVQFTHLDAANAWASLLAERVGVLA